MSAAPQPRLSIVSRTPAANMGVPAQRIRILVVDDHPAVRRGLLAALECERDIQVLGATVVNNAVELCHPDVDIVLMDLAMERGEQGIQTIRKIRAY